MPPKTAKAKKNTKSQPRIEGSDVSRRLTLLLAILCLVCILGLAAFVLIPISNGYTRGISVGTGAALAIGVVALFWRVRILRWFILSLYSVVACFVSLPGNTGYNRLALRQETARALQRYQGVEYCWGGEGVKGIDCSGLVRRGLIDALFTQGVQTLNPYLVRRSIALWWTDFSAKDLANGAGRQTRRLFEVKALKGLDDPRLDPGDFAITADGAHALAYLGNRVWIEADPVLGKVVRVDTRKGAQDSNPWLHVSVGIYRWRMLDMEFRVGRQP